MGVRTETDLCTPIGAQELALRISAYWRERGHAVEIETREARYTPSMRAARVDVRSNLINGLPAALRTRVRR